TATRSPYGEGLETWMRYEPRVGEEFPLTKEVIVAKTKHLAEITRSAIAISVVSAGILVLLVTAIACAYQGEFKVLQTVWAVIAAPMGCIVGYYFRGSGANG